MTILWSLFQLLKISNSTSEVENPMNTIELGMSEDAAYLITTSIPQPLS
jgi:hypothetical protein